MNRKLNNSIIYDNFQEEISEIKDDSFLDSKNIKIENNKNNSSFSNHFNYQKNVSSFEELIENLNDNDEFIKEDKNAIINNKNYDIFERLKAILDRAGVSEIYKKKTFHIFETFVDYLSNNKKKNKITLSGKKNITTIIKRINIKDISSFIKNYKEYRSKTTKYNVLCLLRRLARVLNNEPNLNFKKKINPPKNIVKSSGINKNDLKKIASYFREKKDIENLLLFYFLYYGGLNFYMISRIMIKNLNKSFKTLILIKGAKKRVHILPDIIKDLLFNYFKDSRTYKSKYIFFDNYLGKKGMTRSKYIQYKFITSINKEKILFKGDSKEIISIFSKLRRAKNLPKNDYYLFDLSLSEMIKEKILDKNQNEMNKSLKNDFDEINRDYNQFSFNAKISDFSQFKELKNGFASNKNNFHLYEKDINLSSEFNDDLSSLSFS